LGTLASLYVRVLTGVSHSSFPATSNLSGYDTTAFTASVPFGILIALNPHVGLDLGMRLNASVSLFRGSGTLLLTMPVGYFGVQSFF
jgi:hypothetical protein